MSRTEGRPRPEEMQQIRVLDIGGDAVIAGLQLVPVVDGEHLSVRIVLTGGRRSPIVGVVFGHFQAGEIARIPLADLRRAFSGGEARPAEAPDTKPSEPPVADPPRTLPPLTLVAGGE